MLKKFLLFAVVFSLASLAVAQSKTQQQALAQKSSVSTTATTTCNVTFSSGTALNASRFCVTVNGNISQFSVEGKEMIAVGAIFEGYGVCDLTANVAYYDWASADSGNWGSPTFARSGNIVTVTRLTSDGIWRLTQTITQIPATATGPGSAKVQMMLKNLTGISRTAVVLRSADVDADGTFSNNDFESTSQTVFGLEQLGRGLSSTNNTPFNSHLPQIPYAQNIPTPPNPCNAFTNFLASFHGDGSIVQYWSAVVAPNATMKVTSTYKPI